MGGIRKEAIGKADMSANAYKTGIEASAVMYDRPGKVGHEDLNAAQRMTDILAGSGFWSLWQTVQRDTLGMRELLPRVDIDKGMPTFRLVYPQWVVAEARPQRPDTPVHIEEARLRTIDGKEAWTWDILDSETGTYKVVNTDGDDITRKALAVDEEETTPMSYPYVKSDGTMILPYSMYHAKNVNRLWDTFSTAELYEGTLDLAVLYTFLGHCIRKASWPQRYAVGVQIPGVGIEGETNPTRRASVVTDPSTVLLLESIEDNQSPQIGQWSTSADVVAITEAISRKERRMASLLGHNPADLQRTSGDPRSGYALAVNRDAQRTLQRRFEPQFAKADANTLMIVAVLLNRWNEAEGTPGWVSLPEDGWSVTYRGIPLSADEKTALREDHRERVADGTLDIVTAYMEQNPGTTQKEAEAALMRIRELNARFGR